MQSCQSSSRGSGTEATSLRYSALVRLADVRRKVTLNGRRSRRRGNAQAESFVVVAVS